MTHREFRHAIEVFGLAERASLEQIKARYRDLVKRHHPDQKNATNPETMHKVNHAYKVLTTYCEGYRYCFTEEEFLEQVPEERMRRQFDWDPVWGGRNNSDT